MRDTVSAFAAHAAEYHAERRRLVACFDAFYGTAVDLLRRREGPLRRVLDLGAGTGLLSAAILARHPAAELVLLDGAPEMLERARTELPQGSIETVVGDLRDPLPDGPFDAIVSALAIHHIDDEDKRDLFLRIHAGLRPGGAFVNAEHVAGPTPWLERVYRETWRDECRAAGAGEHEIAHAEERMKLDRSVAAATQLRWMADAGLHDCDCFFKQAHFAVLAGWRAAAD